jgi:2-dehydro-3-deoxyphosphogluconate aldolase / (4S)-4-hydroxy-2-oxoglutarate aldolase
MGHVDLLREFLSRRLVAIFRTPNDKGLVELALALHEAGISMFEVTLTIPNGLAVMQQIRNRLDPNAIVGAGTVLDQFTASSAVEAGAQFLVAPTFSPNVIEVARKHDVLSIPGCFTPTETLAAWNCGADIIKVFPADVVGPSYFRNVLRPLPQLRLMATGPIGVQLASEFFDAGACAIGVGGELSNPLKIPEATALARRFVELVRAQRPCH